MQNGRGFFIWGRQCCPVMSRDYLTVKNTMTECNEVFPYKFNDSGISYPESSFYLVSRPVQSFTDCDFI